jgi:hypothetical protein
MLIVKEIQEFAQIRAKARAYLCYLISRNLAQSVEASGEATLEDVIRKVDTLKDAIPDAEVIYVLDGTGRQIIDNVSKNPKLKGIGKGDDRSDRAYYYRTVKEHRCILTDPYPSLYTNELVVTASFPIYDVHDNLVAIICVDISLKNLLKMVHPTSVDSNFGIVSKWIYAAFSAALFGVAILLFIKGVTSFLHFGFDVGSIDINEVFKSTILLTLSLAIADLVKAIFEEEVLGKDRRHLTGDDTHQTMIKFLGSIIIALSIEALMLVFKSALIDPSKIQYAVYLITGVSFLLISLSLYIKFSRQESNKRK